MPFHTAYNPNLNYRCAIYARFSSDMQNRASAVDQIRNCRDAASSYGWTVLDEYIRKDEAVSGQSLVGRDGLIELLEIASQPSCPFDGILIDDTSRFGRNLSDTLPLTDRFGYRKVFLHFVNRRLDSRDPNFRSLFIRYGEEDENFSRGLAEKVHRAHRGRVLNHYTPSGQCYGYQNVGIPDPERRRQNGHPRFLAVRREINPEEAEVIVRIYKMYISGLGYRSIADILNGEGIPSPLQGSGNRPREWCSKTVAAILNQPKYRGVHIWNKTKTERNPDTGRKETRPRPESEWERVEVPEWRIISEELWAEKEQASIRHRGVQQALGGSNRTKASRKYIFSGKLTCGVCDGKVMIVAARRGRPIYGCYNRRSKGKSICSNGHLIMQHKLQDHLLHALAQNLLDPEMRQEMTHHFQNQLRVALETQARTVSQAAAQEGTLKGRLKELQKQEENAVNAIVDYGGSPALQARLDSLKNQIQSVETLLARAHVVVDDMPSPEVIEEFLNRKLKSLAELVTGDPLLARQEIQKRVDQLKLTPIEVEGRVAFEVTGDVRLFAPGDVMLGGSTPINAEHYKLSLPFHHVVTGSRLRTGTPYDSSEPALRDALGPSERIKMPLSSVISTSAFIAMEATA